MGISKYNSEGYSDPTSHAALSGIRREEKAAKRACRPLVYICSPFAGDTEKNTEKARRYSRFAVKNGAIPLAPHLLFPRFLDDTKPAERAIGMFMGRVLLGNANSCGCSGKLYPRGWRRRLRKRKSGVCQSAISQKTARRLEADGGNESYTDRIQGVFIPVPAGGEVGGVL